MLVPWAGSSAPNRRVCLVVATIGPQTAPLRWNEPMVRNILQSWASKVRSVCLITPPSAFLLDERVFVSLGVLKVAASLEAQNYQVNFLDLSGVENYLAPLEDYLTACQDAAVGITTTTPQLPSVMRIAETIRRLRPDLKLILGGPHVTLVYSAKKLEVKRGIVNGRGHRSAAELERACGVLGGAARSRVRCAVQRRRRAGDLRGAQGRSAEGDRRRRSQGRPFPDRQDVH